MYDDALLLLTESQRFLDGNRQLLLQRFVALVRREVKTVEAVQASLANGVVVQNRRGTYQVCDFGRALTSPDFSIVNLLGPSEP